MMLNFKKIAVWGLGKHAINRILPAISKVKGLRLVGVCSRTKSVVKECAENMNCLGWTDPDEMLKEKDLDIIYLSTPIGLHAEQGRSILLAGKHLWCEKPFTADFAKTEALIRLSRTKKLSVAEGFMYLYHKQFKEIRNRIYTDQLGAIKEVSMKFGFPQLEHPGFRYKSDLCGGALWDVGTYSISAALNLFKNESAVVKFVDIRYSENYDVDFDGTVILDFSGGARVISTWYIGAGYRNEIDVWGEKGSLFSDKIFSKVDGYTPELRCRDKYGVEMINKLDSINQFVAMFNQFLLLLSSKNDAEQERKDIIQRAKVMDEIVNY